jgi:hypothetical protein
MKVDVWQNGTAGSGGRSKVAAMVEKIQESLATQRLAKSELAITGDEPPSSDPLPDTASKTVKQQQDLSPFDLKTDVDNAQLYRRMPPPSVRPHFGARLQAAAANVPVKDDDETSQAVNASNGQDNAIPAPLHLQSKAPLPAFRRPSIRRTPSDNVQNKTSAHAPLPLPALVRPHLPTLAEDLDEFGDDMEFSTEDLDELLSQPLQNRSLHDIAAHPNPPPQRQPLQQLPVQQQIASELIELADDDFDDDEFACDDLDETSFIEAELQATQAYRASRPSSK